jgi:hypothetical protein
VGSGGEEGRKGENKEGRKVKEGRISTKEGRNKEGGDTFTVVTSPLFLMPLPLIPSLLT